MQEIRVPELDSASLNTLLSSNPRVVVEFWGTWCAPCKAMAPILAAVGAALRDRVAVGKIDIGAHPEAASLFKVMAVPTFLRFENGEESGRHTGALSQSELEAFCEGEVAE